MAESKSKNVGKILKCPHCGSSDVSFDVTIGKLKCQHCKSEIEPELVQDDENPAFLKGKIVGSGAEKIIDSNSMITMKCTSCGAAITLNTDEAMSARCPWCRHTLSINDKLPNGAVPDMILPFRVTREYAFAEMAGYMKEHKSLAKKQFVNDFRPENLMGVFLPYMVVDMNVSAEMSGEGEHQTRRYTVGSGDNEETRYDADLYSVHRKFDLIINDLTIEASSDKLNQNALINTNNIVNAIMPFDTQNAVKWDARLVKGYACEKRDVNINDLDKKVKLQVEDIMRYQMQDSISLFDRGVRWDKMRLEQKGVKWNTAYMPVWLYCYLDKKSNGESILHYIAVNARTGEMVGSSPVDVKRVLSIIFIVPLICLVVGQLIDAFRIFLNSHTDIYITPGEPGLIAFGLGFMWMLITGIGLGVTAFGYRNKRARHLHEKETSAAINNLEVDDVFKEDRRGLRNSQMTSRNDNRIRGIQQQNAGMFVSNKIAPGDSPKYKAVRQSVVAPQKTVSNNTDTAKAVAIAAFIVVWILMIFAMIASAMLSLLF